MYEDGEIVRTLLRKAGLSSTELQTPVINLGEVTARQEALRDKLVTNPGAAGAFLMGLRFVLTDIIKVRWLGETCSGVNMQWGEHAVGETCSGGKHAVASQSCTL